MSVHVPRLQVHLWGVGACLGPGAVAARGTGWRTRKFPALVAALGHPTHGWTLFDTGYDSPYFEATRRWPHRLHRWALPVALPQAQTLEHRMTSVGLAAGDVRRVVISHFHLDHIAGLHRFPDAALIYPESGWEAVRGRSGWQAARAIYHPDLVDEEQIRGRGHPLHVRNAETWEEFPQTWNCFGDGSLRFVALPGHAPGQIGAVFHRQPDGRQVFLVADALWTRDNLRGHPPHPLAGLFMHDWQAFGDTLRQLGRFAVTHPHTLLVPSHCAATLQDWKAEIRSLTQG